MLANILIGLQGVFTLRGLLFQLVGLVIGVIFGALPGFSATMGVAVFVPFSYVLDPSAALLLLSGIYCGGVYGGSIPAVLIGIPGTPASVPTSFEGRALVRQGRSGEALAIGTFSSAFGGFVSLPCCCSHDPRHRGLSWATRANDACHLRIECGIDAQ